MLNGSEDDIIAKTSKNLYKVVSVYPVDEADELHSHYFGKMNYKL